METAPYSSTPIRQTITAAVHRGETPPVQSARRCQEPVARMRNRPASTCPTTPSTRHPVISTPSPNMSKGASSALSRYFLIKRQEDTAIKKDRLEGEKKRRAGYERKKEKAKRRLSALEKMELSVTKKAKIMEIMKPAYMSPDEENGQDGFITHQQSW